MSGAQSRPGGSRKSKLIRERWIAWSARRSPGVAAAVKVILSIDGIKPPLTGIGKYTWELANRIPTLPGIELMRFVAGGNWVRDVQSRMKQSPAKLAAHRRLLRNGLVVAAYRKLSPMLMRRRLRRFGDHVYHGSSFYLPPFAGPSIATFHDLSIYRYPECHPPERVAFMTKEIPVALRRASFLITDSEYIRREVIEFFDWPADRIKAIPLGVSDEFHPRNMELTAGVLDKFGLQHGGYALCVATIEPRKNIGALLRAYGSLPIALRTRYTLVLAGDRGWRSESLHEQIGQGQSQGWLRYLGYVDTADLPALYAGARGFVFPSLYEGFGLPLLEAMASGLPVLTSANSTLAEVASGAALLVDPEDDDAIASGIHTVLEDDAWRSAAIARSLAVAAKYSWDQTARRTVEIYGDVSRST